MTARRDPERLIKAFLEQGPSELPDRSLDAVRAAINEARQWVVIGPWREDQMTRYAKFALAAAAVVLVAVVGIRFLPNGGGVGGPAASIQTPSPTPTADQGGPLEPGVTTPPDTPEPQPPTAEATSAGQRLPVAAGPPKPLEAGTYLTLEGFEPVVSITVPEGWYGAAGRTGLGVGQGLDLVNQRFADAELYLDVISMPYADAVAAFEQLGGLSHEAEPSTGTVDGYEATIFEARAPGGQVLLDPIAPGLDIGSQSARQIFVDVEGTTILIRTAVFEEAAEPILDSVIESIRFP